MNECKRKLYLTNTIITHSPIVCFGGFGDMPCRYLKDCLTENKSMLNRKAIRILKKLEINDYKDGK